MTDIEIGKAFHEKFYSYSEKEIDDMVEVAKELLSGSSKQIAGLEKRVKLGNRNARIDELEWCEHNADDINFSIRERINLLKQGKNI